MSVYMKIVSVCTLNSKIRDTVRKVQKVYVAQNTQGNDKKKHVQLAAQLWQVTR